jgi:hypothetical protein
VLLKNNKNFGKNKNEIGFIEGMKLVFMRGLLYLKHNQYYNQLLVKHLHMDGDI